MKKIIVVAILVMVSVSGIMAQDWGTPGRKPESFVWLAGHLEAGWMPVTQQWNWSSNSKSLYEDSDQFYVSLGLTLHFSNYVFLGGSWKTWMVSNKDDSEKSLIQSYQPLQIEYTFFAGLRYKNVEVGFRHTCAHPVLTGLSFSAPLVYDNRMYEEVYVRFEF